MIRAIRQFLASAGGNVSTMMAIAAIPTLVSTGVAVDSIRAEHLRTRLAAALDGAVLAGAAANNGHTEHAAKHFDGNFAMDGTFNLKRSFKKSGDIRIEGTASAELDASLTRVLGYPDLSVEVKSVAETAPGDPDTSAKLCILALSPNASQALLANSGADVNASSCEIHVKSTGNPAAIFNAGTTLRSAKTCIQGTSIIDNGGSHPNLKTGCTTLPDPYAGKVPAPGSSSCDFSNGNYSGKVTLDPGVYCGWHNFNAGANVKLNAGTYVITDGGWNVNGGEWDGKGVTFYFADTSKIQFNSAVKAKLSAPDSGDLKGFLFAEKPGLSKSHFICDDNKGFDMTGIIYLPSRDVIFNSSTKIETRKITAVMNTVIFNGVTWNLVHYSNGPDSGSDADKVVRLTK